MGADRSAKPVVKSMPSRHDAFRFGYVVADLESDRPRFLRHDSDHGRLVETVDPEHACRYETVPSAELDLDAWTRHASGAFDAGHGDWRVWKVTTQTMFRAAG
jgi:hypothetical protein